jgi:hypothetical protein
MISGVKKQNNNSSSAVQISFANLPPPQLQQHHSTEVFHGSLPNQPQIKLSDEEANAPVPDFLPNIVANASKPSSWWGSFIGAFAALPRVSEERMRNLKAGFEICNPTDEHDSVLDSVLRRR